MSLSETKIKEFLLTVFIILSVLTCSSCGEVSSEKVSDPEPMPGQIKVYCTNSSADGLQWENYDLKKSDIDEQISQVLDFLSRSPRNSLYKRVIPQDVSIVSYEFGKDGQLILDFSSEYLKMDKIQEILCRAGVVKTFCQLEEIEYIEFTVNETPLKILEQNVGLMRDSDFVDSIGNKSDLNQKEKISVFMTDEDGKLLQEYEIDASIDGTRTMEEVVLEYLIKGPGENSGLYATVNKETKINKIRTTYDGICYVDFSEAFLNKPGKVSDDVAVYSVVNTLCEMTGVKKVKITVDGNQRRNYGKISIYEFLSLRPELIAQEKAGETTGN